MSQLHASTAFPIKPRKRPLSAQCALDLQGVVSWTSAEFAAVLGRPVDCFVGERFADLWADDDRTSAARAVQIALQNETSELAGRSASGDRHLTAFIELRRGAAKAPMELLVSVEPVGQAETGHDEARMLFDAVPMTMWITRDPEGAFILGNSFAERHFGFTPGTNQSLSAPDGIRHDHYRILRDGVEVPARELPVQRSARGEDVRDEEYELRYGDGRVRQIILNASPMRDETGAVVGSVCVELDVTGLRRVEQTQQLLLQCSRATDTQFFAALTAAISQALGARQVYVAEVLEDDPRVLRTIAAHVDGLSSTFGDFIPVGTPCADTMKGHPTFIATGVLDRYPDAEVLKHNRVDSYIGTPLHAVDGSVIGIIGVLHDHPFDPSLRPQETVQVFAARAAAELQRIRSVNHLRQSEQKHRIITDVIPSLIAYVDAEERYQFANAAYRRWFGIDPSDMKNRKIRSVMSERTYATVRKYVRRALLGERISFEAYLPDLVGPPRHVSAEYVPQRGEDGKVAGFFAFVNDISERKEQEEALANSEVQFRTLFEHLPVGAALVDRDGKILLENEVFARLLPYASAASLELSNSIFDRACVPYLADGTPSADEEHPVREALVGRVTGDVECLCSHPDGRKLWVRLRGIPIRGKPGEVFGALIVVDDVHNEKLAEGRRKLLINELNHRVKNTLAGVQSIAAQTFRGANLTPEALEAFEERLMALSNVHNLLSQEGWESADLRQVSNVILEPLNPGADRLRIAGPPVRLKPQAALALAMALHELATNAVKYGSLSKPGGTLTLSWHLEGSGDDKRIKLRWEERGGPLVTSPVRKGFGTRLIERSLAFELDSASSIRFEPEGVVCEIDANFREIVG